MLSKIGEKLFKALGDRECGDSGKSYIREAYGQMANFHTLCDLFPYDSYDEEHSLFINEEGVGFVVETPPLVGASEQMQKEISNLFLNIFPEESGIQFMLWADPHIGDKCDDYCFRRVDQGDLYTQAAKERTDYLKSLVFNSRLSPYTLRNFRCIISFNNTTTKVNSFVLEEVSRILKQVKTTLKMVGLFVKVWKPEDLINTLHGILHLDLKDTNATTHRWNKFQRLSDQLDSPDSNVQVRQNSLLLNDGKIEARVLKVAQYPDIWSLHAMGFLIGDENRDEGQIPCPFILHYGVYIPKQDGHKAKVMAKASYVERQANSPLGKYLPSIQREAVELAYVRDQLEKDGRIVHTQFNIVLLSTPEQISDAEQRVKNCYSSKEWKVKNVSFLGLPSFLMCMPMMWTKERTDDVLKLKMTKTTLSTESENLLPLQGEWHGTKTPGMVLAGKRGQIFNWCPFDSTSGNYNSMVIGKSGSGKSVFMQEEVAANLGLGGKTFVLDIGRSFEKTCSTFKGQFIQFTPKANLCLNPFSTICMDDDDVARDSIAMLKSVLLLMASPSRGLSDIQISILDRAMTTVWNDMGSDATITDIAKFLSAERDPKSKDLGTMLFPYTVNGNYGRFFNGKSNVNLDNDLVVVEFSELDSRPDLKSVILQTMTLKITDRVYKSDRSYPNVLIVDEASDNLKDPYESEVFDKAVRRFRKYEACVIFGTQNVEDFFLTPGATSVFNNCDWRCFFNQNASAIQILRKADKLVLTPHQESLLMSLRTSHGNYSEMMITGSDGYAVGRLILDPFSAFLYSTKGEDYSAVKRLMDQGMPATEAINYLTKQRLAA